MIIIIEDEIFKFCKLEVLGKGLGECCEGVNVFVSFDV